MAQYITEKGFDAVCNYVSWSVTESVELSDTIANNADATQMYNTCRTSQKAVQDIYRDLEKGSELNQVSSHALRKDLYNYVLKWLQKVPGTSAEKLAEYAEKTVIIRTTSGSENPNYVLYWTNEDLLSLFSLSLTGDESNVQYPLVPSSTILLRFYMENTNLMVEGLINDQKVPLTYCNN